MTSLNPVFRVGRQIEEMIKLHPECFEGELSKQDRKDLVLKAIEEYAKENGIGTWLEI